MSNNRLKAIKTKLQDPLIRKDLTPKSSKYSPKISPVYSSIRNGLTSKPVGLLQNYTSSNSNNSKIKVTRPSTSKNSSNPHNPSNNTNFFHSNSNQPNQSTQTKRINEINKRLQMNRINNNHQNHQNNGTSHNNKYQYQPRSKSKSPIRQPDEIIREEVFVYPKSVQFENRDIRIEKNIFPEPPKVLLPISHYQPAKHSQKMNGIIKAYSASTNHGPVRDYNQDRVAIILNIPRPENCQEWKKVAYFGVFDGHGGMNCADFLRDNLHNFVSKQKSFPSNMKQALTNGFAKCQKVFLQQSYSKKLDHSGSCAIVTFFYGQQCFIANVGDSRAIMSSRQGEIIKQLSVDHKASDQYQQKRIIDNGGKIYQTKLRNSNPNVKIFYQGEQHDFIMGPHRVFPGRLSVTRTFGDIEAKLIEFNGNPKAITCDPEIRSLTIQDNDDFILLASDGIYDKLSNQDVVTIVWDTLHRDKGKFKNIHEFCGKAVQNIMKLAFYKKTLDNITVVMIALQGLQRFFNKLQGKQQGKITKDTKQQMNTTTMTNNNKQAYQTVTVQNKGKMKYKYQAAELERKYIGRSTSPSNYSSLRTRSFYGS